MHPHFKLDLSKCINDDYMEGNSVQSSEQKVGSNFLDDIKQSSMHQDIQLIGQSPSNNNINKKISK